MCFPSCPACFAEPFPCLALPWFALRCPALLCVAPRCLQKLETYVTGVNSQRGTLPWTAPEILRTPDTVTEKVDVYRWGWGWGRVAR